MALCVARFDGRRRDEMPILVEACAYARWSVQFLHAQFACGRRIHILKLVIEMRTFGVPS